MAAPRLAETRFLVEGLNCASRATKIEAAVRRLPGVVEATASACTGVLIVNHLAEEVVVAAIERQVRTLGHRLDRISRE